MERDVLNLALERKVREAYDVLSAEFGRRRQNDQTYREKYKELTKLDPRIQEEVKEGAKPKAPTDDRFDDYYKNPKESGYRAVQDTFFIPHRNGALVEFEGQIVDEFQHTFNTTNPRTSHIIFKSGMAQQSANVFAWKEASKEVLQNRSSTLKTVAVRNWLNEIVIVPPTMGGFAESLYSKEALQGKSIYAIVDSIDPFSPPERTVTSWDAPLRNNDRIKSFELIDAKKSTLG